MAGPRQRRWGGVGGTGHSWEDLLGPGRSDSMGRLGSQVNGSGDLLVPSVQALAGFAIRGRPRLDMDVFQGQCLGRPTSEEAGCSG